MLCPRSVVNPLYMVLMYVFNETGKPSLFYVAPLELMMRTLVLGFMIMSLCMHGLSLVYERKKKFTAFMFMFNHVWDYTRCTGCMLGLLRVLAALS